MAFKVANLAQHEVLPVTKFIRLMREPRKGEQVHIMTVFIGESGVMFSLAAPRGKVVIEHPEFDITIEGN